MDNKLWMNYESVQEDPELSAIFPSASHFPLWPHEFEWWDDNLFRTPLLQEGYSDPFCHTQVPFQDEFAMTMSLDDNIWFWDDMIMEASMPKEEDMGIVQHNTKGERTTTNKRPKEEDMGIVQHNTKGERATTNKRPKEEDMGIVQHNTKGERATTNKRAREERVLTFEEVSQYFYMPIIQAAKELNVGLTLLKKKCRELGFARWPHRKMKSMQTLIKNVQELGWKEGSVGDMQVQSAIEILEQEQRLMEMRPSVQMQNQTKRLRQACFKANYKKRKLDVWKEERLVDIAR